MPKVQPPELKDFMDKRLSGEQRCRGDGRGFDSQFSYNCVCLFAAVALNANRLVTGVLRGFDQFMNIVLDNTVDEKSHTDIGMVVSWSTVLSLADRSASHPALNLCIAAGNPRKQHSDSGSLGAIVVVATVAWASASSSLGILALRRSVHVPNTRKQLFGSAAQAEDFSAC